MEHSDYRGYSGARSHSGRPDAACLSVVLIAGLMWYYFYRTKNGFRFLAPAKIRSRQKRGHPCKTVSVWSRAGERRVMCACRRALSLGQVTMFTEGMTAGRGFIALVATMLGQSGPLGVTAASLLFGFMDALSIRFQAGAPTHFTQIALCRDDSGDVLLWDKSFQQDALKQGSSSR